ncbi:MAG: DUF2282 domain-containing protein [Noviherbaspirillum sp.]
MDYRLANAAAICAAIAAALLAVQQNTHLLPGSVDSFAFERERCYGVVRAGRNDCGTAQHACAGRAAQDARRDEWLMLPAGTCDSIVGGTTRPASGEPG